MRNLKCLSLKVSVLLLGAGLTAALMFPDACNADELRPEIKISGLIYGQAAFFMGNSQTDAGAALGSFSAFDIPRGELGSGLAIKHRA